MKRKFASFIILLYILKKISNINSYKAKNYKTHKKEYVTYVSLYNNQS